MYNDIEIYYLNDVLNKREQLINNDAMLCDLNNLKHFNKRIIRLL